MLSGSLAIIAVVGVGAALMGGVFGGVMLAGAVNFSAAVGRLAFESIVQSDAPDANRGRAFAQFETKFQMGWVAAGVIPVLLQPPGRVGFITVGLIATGACILYVVSTKAVLEGRRPPQPLSSLRSAGAKRRRRVRDRDPPAARRCRRRPAAGALPKVVTLVEASQVEQQVEVMAPDHLDHWRRPRSREPGTLSLERIGLVVAVHHQHLHIGRAWRVDRQCAGTGVIETEQVVHVGLHQRRQVVHATGEEQPVDGLGAPKGDVRSQVCRGRAARQRHHDRRGTGGRARRARRRTD